MLYIYVCVCRGARTTPPRYCGTRWMGPPRCTRYYLGDACRIDCVYGFSYILECSAYMSYIGEFCAFACFAPPRAVTRLCKEQLDKVASQGVPPGVLKPYHRGRAMSVRRACDRLWRQSSQRVRKGLVIECKGLVIEVYEAFTGAARRRL